MKKRIVLGIFILVFFLFVKGVLAQSFDSVTSDKTYYKNGDIITVTADLDAAGYIVIGNFSNVEDTIFEPNLYETDGNAQSIWVADYKQEGNFGVLLNLTNIDPNTDARVQWNLTNNLMNINLSDINNITYYTYVSPDANGTINDCWFIEGYKTDCIDVIPIGGFAGPYLGLELDSDNNGITDYYLIEHKFATNTSSGWYRRNITDDTYFHTLNVSAGYLPVNSWSTTTPAKLSTIKTNPTLNNSRIYRAKIYFGGWNPTQITLGTPISTYVDNLKINDIILESDPTTLILATDLGNGNYQMSYTIQEKSDGTYKIPIKANNVLNDSLSITIDNIAPIISNEQISPVTIYNTNNVTLTATVTEANIQNVTIESNFEGTYKNYTAINTGGYNYQYIIEAGNLSNQENVSYRWHAIDQIGYTDVNNWNSFKVENRPPTFSTIPTLTFNEDENNLTNLSEYATDLDDDVLTFSNTPVNTTAVQIDINGNMMNITADKDWYGNAQFNLVAEDPYLGGITVYPVFVNVISINDAPVIEVDPKTIQEDSTPEPLDLSLNTTDVESDPITYFATPEDENKVNCSVSGSSLTYKPATDWFGTTYCRLIANDGTDNSTAFNWVIIVNNTNDKPSITSTPKTSVLEDRYYTYQVIATDKDNDIVPGTDNLTYYLTTKPDEDMLIDENGLISWLPRNDDVGDHTVTIKVYDGHEYSDPQSFNLTVNNTNDNPTAPVLVSPVDDGTVITSSTTLRWNASTDDDNDALSYYVFHSNDSNNITQVAGPITNLEYIVTGLKHLETYYWYVNASDETVNVSSSTFSYSISLKNAPNITNFYPTDTTISIAENESQEFNVTVSDIDGDLVEIRFDKSDCCPECTEILKEFANVSEGSASFLYTPSFDESGSCTVKIIATDVQGLNDTQSWTVTVSDTNRIPRIISIAPLTATEEMLSIFNVIATDDNGDTITYSINDSRFTVTKINNTLANISWTPTNDDAIIGTVYVNIIVTDSKEAKASQIVGINVENINDEPEITDYSPKYNPIVKSGKAQPFSLTVKDIDSTPTITWYVDDVLEETGTSRSITRTTTQDSEIFEIKAEVVDGSFILTQEWNLTVAKIPIAKTFTEGTTDFSTIADLTQAEDVVLVKDKAKIKFLDTIDLSNVVDLDNNIIIKDNIIGINTDVLTTLKEENATLTMNVNLNSPVIYYTDEFITTYDLTNAKECDFCTITNYNKATGELIFTVDHFTTFMPGEEILKLDIADLEVKVDSKTDKDVKNRETISKEAKPKSTVKVKVTVKNNLEDLKIEDIYVEAILIGIDDGEDLEEESDEFDLRKGRDKTITLNFNVPKEVDEDTYDLDIYVNGEDENGTEYTVEWTIYLEVEKEKHDIEIERVELLPNKLSCVRNTKLDLEIINYGQEEEEEIAYSIFSEALGIDVKAGYFELSEDLFDEDSKLRKNIPIKVADDFESGEYPITIKAYYNKDKLSDTKTVDLIIEDCEVKVEEVKEKIEVKPKEKEEVPVEKEKVPLKISFRETPEYIALLIGGIVILLVLVIFAFVVLAVRSRRR